ncbi:MAG: inositol-3-phosphate synthase [Deltaproteobacteria bacterium]
MANDNTTPSTSNDKLGVLLPGLGAVATTFIAGCHLARKGAGVPIGSLSQLGTMKVDGEDKPKKISELLPIANLDNLSFAGWDVREDDAYAVAQNAGVLERHHLEAVKDELSAVHPMKAAFFQKDIPRLEPSFVKTGNRADLVDQLRQDIRDAKAKMGVDRLVAVWCGSTERYVEPSAVHQSIDAFEAGLKADDDNITGSMLYAWACLKEGVPYANGSPNLTVDTPAAIALANETRTPICGKDFKTGQTLIKTILAPGLKARMLGMEGWFSTNILGNRDGLVLDEPANFKTKEVSKLSVLEQILEPEAHPDLYGDLSHLVRINYYPPRGDQKEGWDNIDLLGWMGYKMQIKVNFLCRDSILAAPVVLDLALFMDLCKQKDMRGVVDGLSIYFKSPQDSANGIEHDLFKQSARLEAMLRSFM